MTGLIIILITLFATLLPLCVLTVIYALFLRVIGYRWSEISEIIGW